MQLPICGSQHVRELCHYGLESENLIIFALFCRPILMLCMDAGGLGLANMLTIDDDLASSVSFMANLFFGSVLLFIILGSFLALRLWVLKVIRLQSLVH